MDVCSTRPPWAVNYADVDPHISGVTLLTKPVSRGGSILTSDPQLSLYPVQISA